VSNFVILGSTGMIGSAVTKYLTSRSHKVLEVNRSGISSFSSNPVIKFDVLKDNLEDLVADFPQDCYVLNFIGLIRHQIDESNLDDCAQAIEINSLFPYKLNSFVAARNFKVLQIGTDCIYSGAKGSYIEGEKSDPIDIYGQTKALGEFSSESLMIIRVSSVGHETKGFIELMDWVLNHPKESKINGYVNHLWNGITSLHIGKILEGVVTNNQFKAGITHLSPSNKMTKYQLVTEIARLGGRSDLVISESAASRAIDRTLSTSFPEVNSNLWHIAGYEAIPTIEDLLAEYFDWCAS